MTLDLETARAGRFAIGVNLFSCAMQIVGAIANARDGSWAVVVLAALGAGVSAGFVAILSARLARERLWREKMQADVASAKLTSAMLERQHDAMVRDFARQASASEPRH